MIMASSHTATIFFLLVLYHRVVDANIAVYNRDNETVDSFVDVEALFGAEMITVMDGLIVQADPADGCKPIQFTFNSSSYASIVLIDGNVSSTCNIPLKIFHAENAGYDAVVVFGISPFYYSKSVSQNARAAEIPALIINYRAGQKILQNYLYKNRTETYWLKLIPNSQDISYYIMLFSVVIGVCLVIMILFMICLLIKCVQERRRTRRNRLSSSQIRQLPTRKFTNADEYDGGPCAICIEDFREGDKLRILPCSHMYHSKCVDPWLLNNHRTCPLCKRKIRIGDNDSTDGSSGSDSDTSSHHESTDEERPLLSSSLPRQSMMHRSAANGDSTAPLRSVAREDARQVQLAQGLADELLVNVVNHLGCTAEGDDATGYANVLVCSNSYEENVTEHQSRPPSTYGSVNNSEGDEFVDALTPGEVSTSSVVNA